MSESKSVTKVFDAEACRMILQGALRKEDKTIEYAGAADEKYVFEFGDVNYENPEIRARVELLNEHLDFVSEDDD